MIEEAFNISGNVTVSKEDPKVDTLLFLFGLPTAVLNCISILVLLKSKKLKFSIRLPALQMAISDMCLGVISCIPSTIFDSLDICITKRYFIVAFYVFGCLTITIMNTDRFISLRFPFQYVKICTHVNITAACLLSWIIAMPLPILENFCHMQTLLTDRDSFQWSPFVIFGIVSINLGEYCYVIKCVTKNTTKKFQASLGNRRCIIKISLFTGCFVLFTFPMFVANMVNAIKDESDEGLLQRLRILFSVMAMINPILNPFLYCFLFTECRFQVIGIFCFWNKTLSERNKTNRNIFFCSYMQQSGPPRLTTNM
ncbi:proteinase-activated receptor 1-like [Saccostrea cucullata]|uniref:proteinase-activated receptor 1-like n=1 Tax=Saccostrea cuccullata TaxID=36930 RepID=UPI002ED22893